MSVGETITNNEYHHGEEWGKLLSSSKFWPFYTSPAHFRQQIPFGEPTSEMKLGTLIHSALLEPESMATSTIIMPDCGWRAKEDKHRWAVFAGRLGVEDISGTKDEILARIDAAADKLGLLLTSEQEKRLITDIIESVLENNDATDIIYSSNSVKEQSFRTPTRKARPDILFPNHGILGDLKTTGKQFNPYRTIQYSHWPAQMAWYESVLARNQTHIDDWVWVVIETKPDRCLSNGNYRYPVHVASALPSLMNEWRDKFFMAWESYLQCQLADKWPLPNPTIHEIGASR